jgi:hypothetical protein
VGGVLVAAATVVDDGVFAALLLFGMTGGVDEPNRDGIDIDESEEVDETGDGIAVTLVVAADTDVIFVLVVGANKFEIVGECFLLDAVVLIPVAFAAAFIPPSAPLGDVAAGDDAIVCFTFGDDNDVDVLVEGTLLLFTVADAPDDGVFPFGIVAVDVVPAA